MVRGELTSNGEDHYRIDGVEEMDPFLMTVVSDSDLWMFVSSTGALTAGRIDADHALFPYETDDRLHRAAGLAGPCTMIARTFEDERVVWRPFGPEPTPGCRRSISKSTLGDRLVFSERHLDWALELIATWAPSAEFGWVRTVELVNHGPSAISCEVLDGFLDVMPAGVDALTEQIRSNLVNAYKRSETGPWGSIAVYSLESLITDRAEPAESLTAAVVWSSGFDDATLHLDPSVTGDMAVGRTSSPDTLLTGRAGAYLLRGSPPLPAGGQASWMLVADTDLGNAQVTKAIDAAADPSIGQAVADDIAHGSDRLRRLLADADGVQSTADPVADAHHLSNVLFNSMRGGTFPHGHVVPVADFTRFVGHRDQRSAHRHEAWFESLGNEIEVSDLRDAALATDDADLVRMTLEYLPLTFARRHGDPSRPWNRFSIRVRSADGSELLAYEGNWRDIFQNWEALLHSFPAYFAHVVSKFVNASTTDGYNPYRISHDGIDWEIPDPDDPWSHIGYWGDHQIVYLLRLLEAWNRFEPDAMLDWIDRRVFVYADVPYRIAGHDDIVADPRNTIVYDEERAADIEAREAEIGTDGRLVVDAGGSIVTVSLLEKLVVPALAKLSNFVPGGGIWLNTQRPEWNDANNALAGPGLSMVTLYHLRRYLRFLGDLVSRRDAGTTALSASVATWLADTLAVATDSSAASAVLDEHARRTFVDRLGRAAESHRIRVRSGLDGASVAVEGDDIARWCTGFSSLLDDSIRTAHRDDGLYDSYNRISFPTDDRAAVDHLGPMLEGQVALLSSGVLDGVGALALVEALFRSGMYRPDRNTFMLYPEVELPAFVERNRVPAAEVERIEALLADHDTDTETTAHVEIFERDARGGLHFRPEFVNAAALTTRLESCGLAADVRHRIEEVYELVFRHRSFTGRSSSMYGYEGIGSVYWHMVSKLLLAVQETYWAAIDDAESDDVVADLRDAYRRVRGGLGFLQDPATFGAIPTDCYSHTPAHAGAQQPGMTGQVKEEILTRFGELGLRVIDGRISLDPGLLPWGEIMRPAMGDELGTARFTLCAVPVTIVWGQERAVAVVDADGSRHSRAGLTVDRARSAEVFSRSGAVTSIEFSVVR